MKKIIKLFASLFCFTSLFSLASCSKENKYLRFALPKSVDGMNLYLTGLAYGKLSSTYVYLGDANDFDSYENVVIDKMSKARPDCDIAFVDVSRLNNILEKANNKNIKLSIIYFDSFNNENGILGEEDSIKSVFVARRSWIEQHSGSNGSMLKSLSKSLVRTNQYRFLKDNESDNFNHSDFKMRFGSDSEVKEFNDFKAIYDYMKSGSVPEFDFTSYKNIYQYCAMFALQNPSVITSKDIDTFINACPLKSEYPFIDNETSFKTFVAEDYKSEKVPEELPQLGQKLITSLKDNIEDKYEDDGLINITYMRNMILDYRDNGADDPKSPADIKTAIIWGSVGGVIVLFALALLIIKRVKTGKNPISIKRALDVDIQIDDDIMERRLEIPKELKAMREKKKLTLEEAAKQLKIPHRLLKLMEEGELDFSKRARQKFIAFYKLPLDYFACFDKTKSQ